MKHLKRLLSALISCATVCSFTAFTVSAAEDSIDTDLYDSTISTESKEPEINDLSVEDAQNENPENVPVVQSAPSALLETPFNVFDIYDAHQKYVQIQSGDKSYMYRKSEGIDVSQWQGSINWQAVADTGIDYTIIRAGYGKYASQTDWRFHENVKGAQAVGLDCGAYWYSYATSVEEAYQEADACYEVIKDYKFTYPIYFDIEDPSQVGLSTAQISAIIEAFCTRLQSRGYYVGLYSFANFLTTKVYESVLNKYAIWVANFNVASPAYNKDYGMWQYTDTGTISGINGAVDKDHCYINYPYLISPSTYVPDGTEQRAAAPVYSANINKGQAGGIDVSVWQGKIDWSKVKSSGKSYAIVRAGYGNLSTQRDKYFEANVKGAQAAGIDCGAYWYSYAESPEDAVREAEACYEVIKGYKFQYPIYYAVDDSCFSSMSTKEITDIVTAFCSTLEKKGYYVGIKSYSNFLNNSIDQSVYSKYDVWVSHYGVAKPDFKKNYNMWQYTTEEKVNGINGYVNADYAYLNFPKVMKDNHLNGC